MAMMKNVTEKKGSIRLSLIRFHSTNKIDNYSRGSGEGKKSKRIYRTSQNIRIINVFLESLLSESFPSLGRPPTLCWSLDLRGGCSGSNLVLLSCILASNVHSYQN